VIETSTRIIDSVEGAFSVKLEPSSSTGSVIFTSTSSAGASSVHLPAPLGWSPDYTRCCEVSTILPVSVYLIADPTPFPPHRRQDREKVCRLSTREAWSLFQRSSSDASFYPNTSSRLAVDRYQSCFFIRSFDVPTRTAGSPSTYSGRHSTTCHSV
jgi:hypothetical protein